jgi:uncharacterized protein YecE (DUF72 family)
VIYIGTSGYYYKDWVGEFYPENLKTADRLGFYAREFKTVEVNSTYYHMPNARAMEGMARRVPSDFVFTIKTPQELTHQRDGDASLFVQFVSALQPLVEAGKFGTVLAQFPYSFHNTPANADYLKVLRERLGDLPAVVEFRTADWLNESDREKTLTLLREQKLGFCCVDLPPLRTLPPPIAEATADVAYVRFHGRNTAKWWEHEESYERYDYTYSKEELGEWIPRIQKLNELAPVVFVFANNHYRGQAVETARQLRLLLESST